MASFEQDDYDNLDEIERALNQQDGVDEEDAIQTEFENDIARSSANEYAGGSTHQLNTGAIPQHNGVLSKHAAEFWFPECRNCTCCNGFKHGCGCCKGGVTQCQNSGCVEGVMAAPQMTSAAATAAPVGAVAAGRSTSVPLSFASAPGGAEQMCKFESSPGGCRFGAGCRFKHSNTSTSGGGAAPVVMARGSSDGSSSQRSPDAPGAMCVYFQRGNCQFGNACRYSHGTGN